MINVTVSEMRTVEPRPREVDEQILEWGPLLWAATLQLWPFPGHSAVI